ncbi:hypothetical protein [Cellulomonas cellasea]|uniref:PknH-like extracellular domain-containing protein n=2 Tax=Cellulomonas cellasea TaxID=43670 RepID=A0A0A0BD48_9CELL|nr:hypothetical protein [Cellulomonas cellasea]KGM03266.1 hypothetical protein Q760_07160 [Cellulomonas cellasea DSM 20118]GEA87445.1 hypothetical protein CCE01nite_13940 [Cellulomonas cellasea]
MTQAARTTSPAVPTRVRGVLLALTLALTAVACSPADTAGGAPAESPSRSAEPVASATPETTAAPVTPTDVPADVLLPAQVFGASTEAFTESTAVEPWRIPDSCGDVGAPAGATAMGTHAHGDGTEETVVGVQQVAAFAVADDAVAAATALVEALGACTDTSGVGAYAVEPVAVGAQGHGLATWYYGAGDDTGLGTYLAVTRRGSAVTLVSGEGGERTVGNARTETVAQTQQAWERLCGYEVAGC